MDLTPDKLTAVIACYRDAPAVPYMHQRLTSVFRELDVDYGVRVKRQATRCLQVAYKRFYRLFRAASYVPIPVDAGDFSLLDRRVVEVMNGLPETNRFLRGLRAWVGFRQTGVPYVRSER